MIVDLHSHFLPADVGGPVETVHRGDGRCVLRVRGHDLELPDALLDPAAQVADADARGLDGRVLQPPPFTVLYELDPVAGIDWSRRLNDGTAAAAADFPGRLLPFATVPLQAGGDAAAAELDRAVSGGHVGVEVLTSVCGADLGTPDLEQFWAAAAALRVPVFVHPHVIAPWPRMAPFHLRNLVGNPAETALTGAAMLAGGLLSRHPDLVVVLAHGGGTLPSLIGRLQHGREVRPEFSETALDPVEGVRRLHFDSVVFDARVLRHLAELVGPDRIVVGSDFPFDMAEADPAGFVARAGLAPDATETVLHAAGRLLAATASPKP